MTRAERYLEALSDRMRALGHTPRSWTKGKLGYTSWCVVCGAYVSCKVASRAIREFPTDTCIERCARLSDVERRTELERK